MAEQNNSEEADDRTEAYELLRKTGLNGGEAFKLFQYIENMASANVVSQLGAKIDTNMAAFRAELQFQNTKLDAQNTKIDAQNTKIDAQNTKYNVLIWVIGFATVILSAVITLNSLLG
ncbi:MAG: hypothetical protein OXD43_15240 [Bacteroidetes bacterium]|nr:hypothetical protein [Bacteroidota bacterium]